MILKLGVYIPVGPLKRLSYQYNYELILKNLCKKFSEVVLVSTSRESTKKTIRNLGFSNLHIISDERTWFKLDNNGKEKFDFTIADTIYKIAKNKLLELQCDILILVDINMYLSDGQTHKLYNYCNSIISDNKLVGWRYRSLQIKENITIPNIRHPWVHNLKHKYSEYLTLKPDESHFFGNKYRAKRGYFSDAPYYFCDIFPPIMTEKDYNDKYEYYIKYLNKYYSNKNQDKDWFKYIRREFNKYNSTPLMPDIEIDEWGKKMIENIPDQSIYDYFDLLGGSKYDRLKFKLLEYKYKLRAQR